MDQRNSQAIRPGSENWLFFSALAMFGITAATRGDHLLAIGLFLLAAFALANNPLKLSETIPSNPSILMLASWACGLAGVIAVIAGAFQNWV